MTAFATANLPTGTRAITTVEELALWCAQILQRNNPTVKFVRTAGQPAENRFQWGVGVDSDSTQMMQIFIVMRTNTTAIGTSVPDWKQLLEDSTATLPTSFTG